MSQLSQNSLDDVLTNEQRFCSQGENTARRTSCLAPVSYSREDTQLTVSRSSNNHLRRWGSASVQDNRCQVSEELEHRIGMIDTSLSRLGMMLDSVQGDVMQVNKAIKEVAIEKEKQKFSEKIIVLLLTVDAIEGVDLMVRAAKRSIVNELEAMLDVVDPQPTGRLGSLKRRTFDMPDGTIQKEIAAGVTEVVQMLEQDEKDEANTFEHMQCEERRRD